ncbi:ATP-binding protein [Brachybacterium halotolerans subsp. kimchii]|uniref:AAA family ATPase n=1 Tax=Brachybacterium halotolerans TaxID=2795215 RepID=UPI001E5E5B5E|nr:ATP-binding protein [Brachybacterium halotolerans]UEJ84270.1 ATP-binding protein [Brachybacterium halotolerans subsp. kimchii]
MAHRSPTLTLFHGPPGAGKTTLARQLEADGVGLRISTDDWQAALGVDLTDSEFHERLQSRLYVHALALLERGVDVILEDGLWMRAERTRTFADARARGARIHWHVFDVGPDELVRRLEARAAAGTPGAVPIPRAELERILTLVEPPTGEELAAVDAVRVHH